LTFYIKVIFINIAMKKSSINNLIREYVLLIEEDEAEEKLKKRAEKSNLYDDEKLLLKHNIIPVVRGEHSFLGAGQYSRVYEVVYKGKHAVAKITEHWNDVRTIKALSDMRGKFEQRLSRHLPVVYTTIEDKYENGKIIYIVVVERLEPLEPHIKSLLFAPDEFGYKDERMMSQIIPVLKDRSYVRHMIKSSLKNLSRTRIYPDVIRKIVEYITEQIVSAKFSVERLDKEMVNLLADIRKPITKIIHKDIPNISDNYIQVAIIDNIVSMIQTFIKGTIFPLGTEYEEQIELSRKFPGAESLIELLDKLKEMGINWFDLHNENIMQRPGTRDIVISDPGLFDFDYNENEGVGSAWGRTSAMRRG
jgi:serine/threonine protein kinase